MQTKPQLTLAICCYKFERFIHEAIEAAFAQTYRPLEIVISDDCSPDASWQRILETIEKHYPHLSLSQEAYEQRLTLVEGLTLVLNRNPKNLGLALHENRLFELSSGEWIVFQSGDDISAPHRLERIADVVMKNPQIRGLYSQIQLKYLDLENTLITEKDVQNLQTSQKISSKGLPYFLGASAVYHRDVYYAFGPLGAKVTNEDQVLPLRAALLGEIERINEPLVLYRKHTSNLSGTDFDNDLMKAAKHRQKLIFARYQSLVDLHFAEMQGFPTKKQIQRYRRLAEDDIVVQAFLATATLEQYNKLKKIFKILFSPRLLKVFISRVLRRYF